MHSQLALVGHLSPLVTLFQFLCVSLSLFLSLLSSFLLFSSSSLLPFSLSFPTHTPQSVSGSMFRSRTL